MSHRAWRVWLGMGLAALSLVLFGVHYLIFHDFHHIAIYTVHDIAFLPLEVLVVTLILHELLERRQRRELMQKLNMVIGAFFSEVGMDLIQRLAMLDSGRAGLADFDVTMEWDDARLRAAAVESANRSFNLEASREVVAQLREFMIEKRQFLLGMLENQNLLENEGFTDALWAVFHLGDELQRRRDIAEIPDTDLAHLTGDMERAYGRLISEWFEHLRHLKARYPYLYSLAVRFDPLDASSQIEVVG